MSTLNGKITASPFHLTPCPRMRKKRPSYSPVKKTNSQTPLSRPYSSNPSALDKNPLLSSQDERLDTGLASLQFEEFSWDNGTGGYRPISAKHLLQLNTYLTTLYPEVDVIEERIPYLIVWCKESIPESSKRPFLIGGLLGVWLLEGQDNLPREFFDEDLGNMAIVIRVNHDLASDIDHYHIPKTETLCQLMREQFPDALGVSFLTNEFFIELPELPINEHIKRVRNLPGRFAHEAPLLKYHNGLRITGQEHKPLKTPNPEKIDGEYDDTDYVATHGYFQPGSMLREDGGNMISAGILVEKDEHRRLTVAIHCWQKEIDDALEKMGDPKYFQVSQGETRVGYISERLEKSDIGLATLIDNVEFRNRFLDIPGGPTKLLPSDMLESDQVYMIDSFVTGRQGELLCKGKRVIKQEDKQRRVDPILRGKQEDLPEAGVFVVIVQGVFATTEPIIYGSPKIRAGVCGSALVRLTTSKEGEGAGIDESSPISGRSSELHAQTVECTFENTGEIGGFMRWSDLQDKTSDSPTPRLYCYAEVTDPLVDAGWNVAKAVQKRKRSNSGDPFTN